MKWIEAKLKKHGVAKKLVPPKSVVAEHVKVQCETILRHHIQQRFDEAIDMSSMVDSVLKDMSHRVDVVNPYGTVTKWAKKVKPESWTRCVDELIKRAVGKLDPDICRRVAKRLER